jgi:hypothetical protein
MVEALRRGEMPAETLADGAGLRIQLELLGQEYSMEFASLATGLKVFLPRGVRAPRARTWWKSRTPNRA